MRARLAAFGWASGNGSEIWAVAALGPNSQMPLMSANTVLNWFMA
jgi:hypothetical protein